MKRPRSYGEDLNEDAGEKGLFKDWARRDPDPDRSLLHRRFYHKPVDTGRKGSGSSSSTGYEHRVLDDDRELSSRSRKRFDHDLDAFDRRKGGFDRYWDATSERPGKISSSSPRVTHSGDRTRRSDSFSAPRREFPKGFRSERDRSRREGSSGSSWRRSSSMKDVADEEMLSRGSHVASEDWSKSRSKDSSSGEPSRSVEVKNPVEVRKESGQNYGGSDMEEGELEPEPISVPETMLDPVPATVTEQRQEIETENRISAGEGPETTQKSPSVERLNPDEEDISGSKDSDLASERVMRASDVSHNNQSNLDDGFDGIDIEEAEVTALEAKLREREEAEVTALEAKLLEREEAEVTAQEAKQMEREEAEVSEQEANQTKREEAEVTEQEAKLMEREEAKLMDREEAKAENDEESQLCVPSPSQKMEGVSKEHLIDKDNECLDSRNVSILNVEVEKQMIDVITEHVVIDKKFNEQDQVEQKEEGSLNIDIVKKGELTDLESKTVNTIGFMDSCNKVAAENSLVRLVDSCDEASVEKEKYAVTLEHQMGKIVESGKDKGKQLATSLSTEANSVEENDEMEGPSRRGFELIFCSETMKRDKVNPGGIVIGKHKDEKLKLEPLDLSLGLPGISSDPDPNPGPNSPGHARGTQSLTCSFRSNSDTFTASMSMSGSQTFLHNPSCSLTHGSMDNYEHSVGSHPIFHGVDQVSDGTIWRGQPSSELSRKGLAIPFPQRMLMNSSKVHQSLVDIQLCPKSSGFQHQSSLSRQSSSIPIPYETRPQNGKEKKMLSRERSSSSLSRKDQLEPEYFAPNGTGAVEKFLANIVSESLQVIGRTLQEMAGQYISFLKQAIADMFTNKDKHEEICRLQEALLRRSDLNIETLSGAHHVLLEILVAMKTDLPDFLWKANNVSSTDLAEIFLNLKCRNLACRNTLPVDECDCKVCSKKVGFCSACMCLVCSKFDPACNTCSWVGCDVCQHWCHTDCALRDSYIRNGRSITGVQRTEMQFSCVACNHPSEMFGFVKDVFKTCAKDWKAETLAKELEYVRRIFSASVDLRGKRLSFVAEHLLLKLENRSNISEVFSCIMGFLAESDSILSDNTSAFPPKELPMKSKEECDGVGNFIITGNKAVGSSSEAIWMPTVSLEKSSLPDTTGLVLSSLDGDRLVCQATIGKSHNSSEKKPIEDEIERIVKLKQAEAEMYQARADNAINEAEGLKRIAVAKNEQIDAEYAGRIAKLGLLEAEERRRQKHEEFQAIETALRDYVNMKTRMEADIKSLMLKMEATQRNLNA